MGQQWISVKDQSPKEGVLVYTKIDDKYGIRNVQPLKKMGNLWFANDNIYVYYTPTHWQKLTSKE